MDADGNGLNGKKIFYYYFFIIKFPLRFEGDFSFEELHKIPGSKTKQNN